MNLNEIVTIDLGSNSFRVLKYDYVLHKIIDEYDEIVGMADGLIASSNISNDAIQRVVNAIKFSSKKIDFDPKNAICVTTAAMRKAKNSNEVISILKSTTRANFNIIDSQEEARLTLLAVKYALKREKIKSNNFILLDIGGGSTELVINTNEDYVAKSFDFGIVTMAQSYKDEKLLIEKLNKTKIEIQSFLKTLNIDCTDYIFISTAGTPTIVASVKMGYNFSNYDKSIVNGCKIYFNDLKNFLNIIKNSSKDEIIKLIGQGRVDYIKVGVSIYETFFHALNKNESIVFDDGLREGVAIDYSLKN